MTHAVYLLGGPGSGKSTLMVALLKDWTPGPYEPLTGREMFGHQLKKGDERGMYLGHLRPGYPGTDALSQSVNPQAILWLAYMDPNLSWVFGEGIRLGNLRFLTVLNIYTDLTVVHLVVEPELAAQRRIERDLLHPRPDGKAQDEKFCKTATTTAANTSRKCAEAGIHVVDLDGSLPIQELAKSLHAVG